MKLTFEKIHEIWLESQMILQNDTLSKSKFGYAVKRFHTLNTEKIFKEYNDGLTDIRIDCALTDPDTKAIIYNKENTRGFAYDKQGLKDVIKKEKEYYKKWEKKEFELTPYFITDIPKLSEYQQELYKGLIIK